MHLLFIVLRETFCAFKRYALVLTASWFAQLSCLHERKESTGMRRACLSVQYSALQFSGPCHDVGYYATTDDCSAFVVRNNSDLFWATYECICLPALYNARVYPPISNYSNTWSRCCSTLTVKMQFIPFENNANRVRGCYVCVAHYVLRKITAV